jgi:hypothetical protein
MKKTKKFNGETYTLVAHPINIVFNKKEKTDKVKKLKEKGFSIRAIDASVFGFAPFGKEYFIWKK